MLSHPQDQGRLLTTKNTSYQELLRDFWEFQKKSDGYDVTSILLINSEKQAEAHIIGKEKGVLAGLEEVSFFLKEEGISFSPFKKDGDILQKKDIILTLRGNAQHILQIERPLLNFLSRLSGIATLSKKIVQKIPSSVLLLPTRKTLWGPIDKKGVVIAGGGSHRLNLETGILIKDNHLALLSGGISEAMKILKQRDVLSSKAWNLSGDDLFWEIEVESEEQFLQVLRNAPSSSGVIMLDNFSPLEIQNLLKKYPRPDHIFCEASGGITNKNISDFAQTGVDSLSSGMLTNSVRALDISMDIA